MGAPSGDTFLAVPIAAVADDWLAKEFLPQAEAILAGVNSIGGLVWLPVDASAEADYLLTKLHELCERNGWKVSEFEVSQCDPYFFWTAVLGTPEVPSIFRSAQQTVMIIRSGELLPSDTVRMHLSSLFESSNSSHSPVILPVFRSQSELLHRAPTCRSFQIPALADASPERRYALAEALATSRLPRLKEEERREFTERILAAGPRSRPQLEYWLETLQEADDPLVQIRNAVLHHDEPAHEPPHVPSREHLFFRFNKARERLEEANLLFHQVCKIPLLFPHQPLRDPFVSNEPVDWFFVLVSHTSCLIFDAGETTLDCLAHYRFDLDRHDIVGEPASTLLLDLRLLRTSLQHALSLDNKDNQQKLHNVEAWYRRQCGEPSPRSDHYRGLVAALIGDWESFVTGIHQVVSNVNKAPSSLVVLNALAAARRHLPLGDFLQLIRESVDRIDPTVDRERVKRKHEQTIQRALGDCCYSGETFYAYARHLVELAVANESMISPVDGDWLQRQGFKGRDIARWKQHFQERWNQAPSIMSVEEFLHLAASEVQKANPQ